MGILARMAADDLNTNFFFERHPGATITRVLEGRELAALTLALLLTSFPVEVRFLSANRVAATFFATSLLRGF